MTLTELKSHLELNKDYEIAPTDFVIGKLDFTTGKVNYYNFTATKIYKIPYAHGGSNPKDQVVIVSGQIHYASGKTYDDTHKLSYTDDEQLDKLYNALCQ